MVSGSSNMYFSQEKQPPGDLRHMSYRLSWFGVIGTLAVMLVSCNRSDTSPVIAQVGSAVLTRDNLLRAIPSEYRDRISRDQYANYVRRWIDDEVVYQEALRRRLDKEKIMRERLAKMKRDLLCGELISRSSAVQEDATLSDAAIQDYYSGHKADFIRETPVVKYLQLVVDNEQLALALCSKAAAGADFYALASKYSPAPLPDSAHILYVSIKALPQEIAQALWGARIAGTPGPVKSPLGFHVLRLIDKQDKGTQCSLDEVRSEIGDRLSASLQKQELDRMLAEYRMKSRISFFPERIPTGIASADSAKSPDSSATR
jgi:hypothetical protein